MRKVLRLIIKKIGNEQYFFLAENKRGLVGGKIRNISVFLLFVLFKF